MPFEDSIPLPGRDWPDADAFLRQLIPLIPEDADDAATDFEAALNAGAVYIAKSSPGWTFAIRSDDGDFKWWIRTHDERGQAILKAQDDRFWVLRPGWEPLDE